MNICAEGQGFGQNLNDSYATAGLTGHTGQDWSCGFGTPIYSPYDGLVYKVITKQGAIAAGAADGGFTGVFMIVDTGVELFEFLVGHCDPTVTVSTQVKKGDQLGTEANHGVVYSGNTLITLAMQAAGDQRGHHRHYQVRPVQAQPETNGKCLTTFPADSAVGAAYIDPQGNYYNFFNANNGFNGCVDPTKPVMVRDLTLGSSGYDVYVLQRFLAQQGVFHVAPTAYFGVVTQQALAIYQKDHNIEPTLGYFGPITRAHVVATLLPIPSYSAE